MPVRVVWRYEGPAAGSSTAYVTCAFPGPTIVLRTGGHDAGNGCSMLPLSFLVVLAVRSRVAAPYLCEKTGTDAALAWCKESVPSHLLRCVRTATIVLPSDHTST